MSALASITKEVLEDLYVNQRLSLSKIAKRFSSTAGTVGIYCHKLGIPVRPPGGSDKAAFGLTLEVLKNLYVKEGLNCRQISERYGCKESVVTYRLGRCGIDRRSPGIVSRPFVTDRQTLHELRTVQKLSFDEIGERLGLSAKAIEYQCRRWDIKKTRIKDLTGQRFSQLTILRLSGCLPGDGAIWECQCDCGEKVIITAHKLRQKTEHCCLECRKKQPRFSTRFRGWHIEPMRGSVGGYVYRKCHRKRVWQHREVMEKMIGRPLLPKETVHHKNGIRHDNRPENLELWTSRHHPGQRVIDRMADAIEILSLYAPHLLIPNAEKRLTDEPNSATVASCPFP